MSRADQLSAVDLSTSEFGFGFTYSKSTESLSCQDDDSSTQTYTVYQPKSEIDISPISNEPLPEVDDAVCIIPNRLYWQATLQPCKSSSVYSFNTDDIFVYSPYHSDFGPVNLAMTYRSCSCLVALLSHKSFKSRAILHWTRPVADKKANAAYLMAAFCVIILKWSPEQAAGLFDQCNIEPFRDASQTSSGFRLTIYDCCLGLATAIKLKWFNYDTFDVKAYEHYERFEHGNLQCIVPHKFTAFSTPSDNIDRCHPHYLRSALYLPILTALGINLVIRLNSKQYDETIFTSNGIGHADIYFLDGSCPTSQVLSKFFHITEKHEGHIGIHCKAGLGRTGTLIGCYAIKHFKFPSRAWIGWNRICRPGSILGPQQEFLCHYEKQLMRQRSKFFSRSYHPRLIDLMPKLTLEEKFIAKYGDADQGANLVRDKYKGSVATQVGKSQKDVPDFTPPSKQDTTTEIGTPQKSSNSHFSSTFYNPLDSFKLFKNVYQICNRLRSKI